MINKKGLTVKELKAILNDAPDDAIVLLNHKFRIANPEDDGTYSIAWDFDPIIECRCDHIEDKERYPHWRSNDKLLWLAYQAE